MVVVLTGKGWKSGVARSGPSHPSGTTLVVDCCFFNYTQRVKGFWAVSVCIFMAKPHLLLDLRVIAVAEHGKNEVRRRHEAAVPSYAIARV
jgi:hypothetical protein